MATQFAVCHVRKCGHNVSGLGDHNDRSKPEKDKLKDNIDPLRTHLNVVLVDHQIHGTLGKAIQERIEKGHTDEKKLRKDAVKSIELNLSGTHEQMMLLQEQGRLEEWTKANQEWIEDRFGKENIVSLYLHMDEKTPHLHAIVVPITTGKEKKKVRKTGEIKDVEKGRLSADVVLGDKEKMKNLQTSYAEKKPFGLERGIEGSKAKHTGHAWYSKVTKAIHEKYDPELKVEPKTNWLGINTETKEELLERVNLEIVVPLKKRNEELEGFASQYEVYKKAYYELKEEHREQIGKKNDEISSIRTSRADVLTIFGDVIAGKKEVLTACKELINANAYGNNGALVKFKDFVKRQEQGVSRGNDRQIPR
jgi:hypothetical protein